MSWLDRNEVLQPARPRDRWPRKCQFTSTEVDDHSLVDLLLEKDMMYDAYRVGDASAQRIIYLIITDDGSFKYLISNDQEEDVDTWNKFASTAKTIIVSVRFVRRYGQRSTATVPVSDTRWLNLVQNLALPPPALELLHDNNGGSASRFSPCSSECVSSSKGPCAYHIWLKPSDWANQEHFVYARRHLHVGQNVVLCASTESEALVEKLIVRMEQYPKCTIFHLLYTYLTFCFYSIENARWEVDDVISALEERTGQSHFNTNKAEQVALHELSLTKDVAWARNWLQECRKAASLLESTHVFTETQLRRYVKHDGSTGRYDNLMPYDPIVILSDSFCARVSQIRAQLLQMEALRTRIETQFSTITALISQRDSQVNIDIATSTKADSELMKGIAVVTMVFLPATFFATFFSMIFFQLGPSDDGTTNGPIRLSASSWIWIYFVCTVPLTVLLTWRYGLKDLMGSIWRKLQLKRGGVKGQHAQ